MIRKTVPWTAPLLVLGLLGSVLPAQEKKPDDKKPESKAEKVEKDKKVDRLVRAGELAGRVVAWDNQDFLLTLSVPVVVSDGIDQGAANAIAQAQVDLVKAAGERDPATRVRNAADAQRRLVENQLKLYKFKTIEQQVEIHVADNAKVRILNLPIKFDEKGFVEQRTRDEIKQLRGSNPKLPGYEGNMDDIKNEATVYVVLAKKKAEPPKEGDKKDHPKEKTTAPKGAPPDKDEPIKLGRTIEATMIVVGAVPDSKDKDK